MPPTIDLRPRPAPPPQTHAPGARRGTLRPGTIVSAPHGVRDLSQVEVVLPGANTQLQALQEEVAREDAIVWPLPGAQVLEMPDPIPLEELPAAKQEELVAGLAQAREQLQALARGQSVRPQPDKRLSTPPRVEPPADAPLPPAPTSVPADAPPTEVPPATTPGPTFCSHCGWDQSRDDPEAPSKTDKLNFLQAVLGQQRFRKAYSLLGGQARVVFRSLTVEESDLCFTQAALDAEAGAIVAADQYFRTLQDYRMALGLDVLDLGPRATTTLPELDGYQVGKLPAKTTALRPISRYVFEKVLVQEPLRRACTAAFYRCQRLTEHLEAHVDDPNFWSAIERQP